MVAFLYHLLSGFFVPDQPTLSTLEKILNSSVVIALVTSITAIVTVILNRWFDAKKEKKAETPHSNNMYRAMEESGKVHPILYELLIEYNPTRITIGLFHNGGKFYSSKGMQRITIMYEVPTQRGPSLKKDFQNLLLSGEQMEWLNQMVVRRGMYHKNVLQDLPAGEMRDLFEYYDMKSICAQPLFDHVGQLIGVLTLSSDEADFIGDSSPVGIRLKAQRLENILTT